MVDEVSLGSEEQSRGIDQIGKAIVQMEQVTQTTAANAEESAAAAEELNAQAETMLDIVSRLHAMVAETGREDGRSSQRLTSGLRSTTERRSNPGTSSSTSGAARTRSASSQHSFSPRPNAPVDKGQFPLEESFQSF
jgi:methyl-accepting chemotaxis protein/methyl-accepting chemotaxis protein-1 (serine sensor receptor)